MKNIKIFLRITISILLVTYLIYSVGFLNIYHTIVQGDSWYFLYAITIIPIFILIKTYKWHIIARSLGAQEGFWISLIAVLTGLGFGVFTPARAGEIMRVNYYKSVDKVMLGSLIVADRLIDLITILVLCIYFIVLNLNLVWALIIVFINCLAVLFLLHVRNTIEILNLLPAKLRSDTVSSILEKIGTASVILTPNSIARFSGLSLINWLFVILQFYFILNMFHICAFNVAFASLPIIQLSNMLPITIAGIGVRENLSVFVMKVYGVPSQVAAIGAFFLFVFDILIPGITGLIFFGLRRKT